MNNSHTHPCLITFNELRQVLILNRAASVLPVRPAQRLHNCLRPDDNPAIPYAVTTQRSILNRVDASPCEISRVNLSINTPTKRVDIKTENVHLIRHRRLALTHARTRNQHERELRILLHTRPHLNISRKNLPQNIGNNILS
nr:MAG TPA: hypothetical protein [Caudoviricetes sp.]